MCLIYIYTYVFHNVGVYVHMISNVQIKIVGFKLQSKKKIFV